MMQAASISSSPARPRAAFTLAAIMAKRYRRSQAAAGFGIGEPLVVHRDVLLGVLDLDLVALQRAVDDHAVDHDRDALLEDAARLAVVEHRHRWRR